MSKNESSSIISNAESIRRIDDELKQRPRPLSEAELLEIQQIHSTPSHNLPTPKPASRALKRFYEVYTARNGRRLKTQF